MSIPARLACRPRSRNKIYPRKRFAVFSRDNFMCQHCGWRPNVTDGYNGSQYLSGIDNNGIHRQLEIDHIIPHSMGGSDDLVNLQALCNRCNMSKGAQV